MSHWRSDEYKAIAERVASEYSDSGWPARRRWLARVGLRRLIADEALWTARYLLRSINRATYKSEPELDALLVQAREVPDALALGSSRSSWAKFNRGRR